MKKVLLFLLLATSLAASAQWKDRLPNKFEDHHLAPQHFHNEIDLLDSVRTPYGVFAAEDLGRLVYLYLVDSLGGADPQDLAAVLAEGDTVGNAKIYSTFGFTINSAIQTIIQAGLDLQLLSGGNISFNAPSGKVFYYSPVKLISTLELPDGYIINDSTDVKGSSGVGGTDDQTAAEVPFSPDAGLSSTNTQDAIVETVNQLLTYINNSLTTLNPNFLLQNGATTGQVLTWNGTNWGPANGGGGVAYNDSIVKDSLRLAFTEIDAVNAGAADGTPTAGAYDGANHEIDITVASPGTNFSIDLTGIPKTSDIPTVPDNVSAFANDANYTVDFDTSAIVMKYPPEFAFRPFPIFYSGGQWRTNFDVRIFGDQILDNYTLYYVDKANGNNSNDGLTRATAKKTPSGVFGAGGSCMKVISGGVFSYNEIFSSITPHSSTKHIAIIVEDPENTWFGSFNTAAQVVWNSYGNGIWGDTRANSAWGVIDLKYKDETNKPKNLIKVKTWQGLVDTLGSCYITADSNFVHLKDEREPDGLVWPITNQPNKYENNNEITLYTEGMNWVGGGNEAFEVRGANGTAPSAMRFVGKNNTYTNSFFNANNANGFRALDIAEAWNQNCVATNNKRDGFNYKSLSNPTPMKVVEIDCYGYNNGDGTANDVNGSSVHDGIAVVRVAGGYFGNHGPNIADVGTGTTSLNASVRAYDSKTGVDFATSTSVMTLAGCHASISSTSVNSPTSNDSVYVYSDSKLKGAKSGNIKEVNYSTSFPLPDTLFPLSYVLDITAEKTDLEYMGTATSGQTLKFDGTTWQLTSEFNYELPELLTTRNATSADFSRTGKILYTLGTSETLTIPAGLTGLSFGDHIYIKDAGSGTPTADFSAVTLLDADGNAISSPGSVACSQAMVEYISADTYQITGKYTP